MHSTIYSDILIDRASDIHVKNQYSNWKSSSAVSIRISTGFHEESGLSGPHLAV